MIVAIPVNEDKTLCISFGRSPMFMIVNTETNTKEFYDNPATNAQGGAGIAAAQFIVEKQVEVLLTPRCGENASQVFEAAKIKIYKTTSLDPEVELLKWKEDKLEQLTKFHPGFHHQ